MSDQQQPPMSEQELRAAYEAQLEEQMKHLRVEDVLVQTVITLINLGGRRAGLAPGTEDERDPEQLRLAVEGARALLPVMEAELGAADRGGFARRAGDAGDRCGSPRRRPGRGGRRLPVAAGRDRGLHGRRLHARPR